MQKVKSATAAGLLGIFLGQYGAHNWYLGKKVLGIIHVALAATGLILAMIAVVIIASMNEFRLAVYGPPAYVVIMFVIAYLILFGNAIWGLVEGIILLAKGDAGLQAQGYTTALGAGAQTTAKAAVKTAPTKPTTAKTPKPLDQKTKKKIIMWTCVGGGVFVALSIIAIIFSLVFKINYGESYRKAKDVQEELSELNSNMSSCSRVVSYVNSTWTNEKTYNEYVSKCLDALDYDGSTVAELGNTSGVKRDKDIKAQYDKFKKAYDKAMPNTSDVENTLKTYKAWHTFIIHSSAASNSIQDDEAYRKAAEALKESGNDVLIEYAEGWLKYALAYSQSYRTYMSSDSKSSSTARSAMSEARTKFRSYINQNEPDIADIVEFEPGDMSDAYTAFNKLYGMISDAYEENYDGKGDCLEIFDAVYCD